MQPHEDALVVTMRIVGFYVKMVMIDQESKVEINVPRFISTPGSHPSRFSQV